MTKILVTGTAGFIGNHVARFLAQRGDHVIGVDNFNDYYDVRLKIMRSHSLLGDFGVETKNIDIADADRMSDLITNERPQAVVHLAAQAGVRYSIDNPFAYEHSNLAGHLSILEACRNAPELTHLVYASSSSVYGDHPASGSAFRESDPVDEPASLYAATKRACELMSATYARLYKIPQSGLRFFTVYGPCGRPDMAYFSFTRKILRGDSLEIYGNGQMRRDFTYIDDIVAGIVAVLDRPPARGEARIFNIGNNAPRSLLDFISIIENACGRRANRVMRPMQPGDVTSTWADVSALQAAVGYHPQTTLEAGISSFVDWYRSVYRDDGELR